MKKTRFKSKHGTRPHMGRAHCTRKIKYRSLEEAMVRTEELRYQRVYLPGQPLPESYRCSRGEHWHVGTRNPGYCFLMAGGEREGVPPYAR